MRARASYRVGCDAARVAQVEFAKNKVYKISMALERKTRSQSRFGSIIHQREMPIDPSTIDVHSYYPSQYSVTDIFGIP